MFPKRKRPFNREAITWTPIDLAETRFVVLLDGRPYAGFATEIEANEAATEWSRRWPAARGRRLTVQGWWAS